ncbi:MAG: FecR domain-containing protein [Rhodospirillaceae bacterium]|nr:FecR domain-containing protein [Rhodospirillaceae bacterium]
MSRARLRAWLSALLLAAAAAAAARAEPDIGVVTQPEFRGALGRRVSGVERQLLFRQPVYLDETVTTGPQGSTAVQFLDDTRLQVGAEATVVLDRFLYDPDGDAGALAITLGKGIFRFVTGRMPKQAILIRTPTASIGVRGTRAILLVDRDGSTAAYVVDGLLLFAGCDGRTYEVGGRQSARVEADCLRSRLVPGRLVPQDPAVEQDVPALAGLLPGPVPLGERGQRDRHRGGPGMDRGGRRGQGA